MTSSPKPSLNRKFPSPRNRKISCIKVQMKKLILGMGTLLIGKKKISLERIPRIFLNNKILTPKLQILRLRRLRSQGPRKSSSKILLSSCYLRRDKASKLKNSRQINKVKGLRNKMFMKQEGMIDNIRNTIKRNLRVITNRFKS